MVHKSFKPLNITLHDDKSKTFLEQAPKLELKVLPTHLKYVYLGEGITLPVIISVALTLENEATLLEVLKKYIQAIEWMLAHIHEISPTYCMHKIQLEEGKEGSIEP